MIGDTNIPMTTSTVYHSIVGLVLRFVVLSRRINRRSCKRQTKRPHVLQNCLKTSGVKKLVILRAYHMPRAETRNHENWTRANHWLNIVELKPAFSGLPKCDSVVDAWCSGWRTDPHSWEIMGKDGDLNKNVSGTRGGAFQHDFYSNILDIF